MEIAPYRVPAIQFFLQTIDDRLLFSLIGISAEHPIPRAEHAAVILVDAVVVFPVMNPMV